MIVSVVVPLHNEESNIEILYKELSTHLPEHSQIVFVNDASTDGSLKVLESLNSEGVPIKILNIESRVGLGPSIFEGIRASDADNVLIMDSDLTHNPSEIPLILQELRIAKLSIGSRYVKGGSMTPWTLHITSKAFSVVLRLLLRIETRDVFGGFLAFKKSDFRQFLSRENFYGFGEYSIRICIFAEKNNFRISEIPSQFRSRLTGQKKSRRVKMIYDYSIAALLYKLQLLWERSPQQ